MAATLDARIRLDSSQFSGGLNRVMRETNTAVGKMSAQFGSLRNVLAGGALGMGAISIATSMFDAAVQAERLQAAMSATAGSASLGKKQLKEVRALAADIGMGVDSAAKSMIQLQAAGMTAGEAMQAIRVTFNAVTSAGGGNDEFGRVSYGMQQVLSAGRILQEDINIIREALPTAGKLMQEAFGASRAEDLQKLGISGRQFVEVLVEAMGKLPQLGDTMGKQIARFDAQMQDFSAKLGESFKPVVGGLMSEMTAYLEIWRSDAQEIGDMLFRMSGGDPEKVRAESKARLEAEEKRAALRTAEKRALQAFNEQATKDEASKNKSIEQGKTLAKVFGKFNDIIKDTAKSARELAFSLEFEESMRAYEYQQRVNALVKELAEVEKEKRAEQYNDFVGPTQGDGWVHPDDMKERERGDWQERVRKAGMNKSERKAERDSEREERRNIIKAADRKTREQMQEIKWNEQWNSFENAKNGKWLDQEATRRKLKDANRKEGLQTIKGAWQTLTDIKDILNKLATA